MERKRKFLGPLMERVRFLLRMCFIVLLFQLTLVIPGNSQAFQRLNDQNGLSTNLCRDIVQDDLGFVWIVTENGLVRFDGAHCKTYQPIENDSTSISCFVANSITKGRSGNIWVTGNDGFINRYDPRIDVFERTYIQEIDDIPDRRIYSHYEDDTLLWMAAEIGLLKHNLITKTTEIFNPRQEIKGVDIGFLQTIHGFCQDSFDPDLLWISTRAGLVSLHKKSMQFEYHTTFIPEITDHGQYALTTLFQDQKGVIWACGGWSGIKSYDPSTKKWEYYFSGFYPNSDVRNDVSDFVPKSESEFWICSYVNGFGTFNKETGAYTYIDNHESMPYAVQKGPILKLISDDNNTIWMAGALGVSYFNPLPKNISVFEFPTKTIQHSLTEIYSTSFEKISDDEVLVGTVSGDGIYLTDLNSGMCKSITTYVGKNFKDIAQSQTSIDFYDLQVNDMLKVSSEKIWVAIDTQFAFYDIPSESLFFPKSTNKEFYRSSKIGYLQLDSKGNMWGLNFSQKSLFKASASTGELIEKFSIDELLPNDLGHEKAYGIWSFYIDENDLLWMHTYSSVIIKNIETNSTSILSNGIDQTKELTGINFFNITGSDNGEILLSSYEDGLQIIYPNERLDSFNTLGVDEGLPIQRVVRVQSHAGLYWLATRKGMVCYNPKTGNVRSYDSKDGLPNDDLLNYWNISLDISEDGDVLFGIPNRFCRIKPLPEETSRKNGDLFFTQINVLGEEKKFSVNSPYLESINLKASENFFTVYFSTNNYSFNADPIFEYRLLGYNEQWLLADNERKASFTKVPGGEYYLEVKCQFNGGDQDAEVIRMKVNIDTPYFKSNEFYILAFLLSCLFTYFFYRWRMAQMRSKEQLKTDFNRQKAELEMNALRAQMNPHFIFNSLNSINKFILINEPRIASQYLTKFSRLIRLILSNSKSKEVSLEDELYALALYVEMEQIRFEDKFHFEQKIDASINKSSIVITPMLIQPYIENAIWHGLMPLEKTGTLSLIIRQDQETLICIIEDNGIGRKKAMELKENSNLRKKSMGMKITSERLKLEEALYKIKTEFEIVDKLDSNGNARGTKVILHIPFRRIPNV